MACNLSSRSFPNPELRKATWISRLRDRRAKINRVEAQREGTFATAPRHFPATENRGQGRKFLWRDPAHDAAGDVWITGQNGWLFPSASLPPGIAVNPRCPNARDFTVFRIIPDRGSWIDAIRYCRPPLHLSHRRNVRRIFGHNFSARSGYGPEEDVLNVFINRDAGN